MLIKKCCVKNTTRNIPDRAINIFLPIKVNNLAMETLKPFFPNIKLTPFKLIN